MKKLLATFTFIILLTSSNAQNWAPIGATWHYTEKFSFWHEYDEDYIKFESVKDTVVMGKNCRKITKQHKLDCNDRPWNEYMYEEEGKVYFYDPNFEEFQVLYDFSANQNDSWTILVRDDPQWRNIDTLNIIVDSTEMININGTDLKKLYVTYQFIYDFQNTGEIDTLHYRSSIIERIGDLQYMFNYAPAWSLVCDGNFSQGLRCYEDETSGLFETGIADSCEYRHHFLQDLMTVREIFDFEIGDVFHFRGEAESQTPNADRITIMDKYYSPDNDTLFYERFHDSYFTTQIDEPPYLEYHYTKETDTVYYTHLDTTLVFYDSGCLSDFTYYHSPGLCDSLVNSCTQFTGAENEDNAIVTKYGKGLGKVYTYEYDIVSQAVSKKVILFYYKKGSGSCGIPDTTVSIGERNSQDHEIVVFPNPTSSSITIRSIKPGIGIDHVLLYDLSGRELNVHRNEDQIDMESLPKGIYFLQLRLSSGLSVVKKILRK